jgi:RNA polymerase sigma factor (sigma-70 family)
MDALGAAVRCRLEKGSGVGGTNDFASLVAAVAQQRDRDAFAQLFDYFAPRLQGYLIRLGSDSGMAEEITQDVMVTLWNKAHLFDPAKSSLATWLYRIARNRRIDGLRRDRLDFVDPMNGFDDEAVDPETDRLIDLNDREDHVRNALESLPPEQLQLVRLAFFDGLSHSEIAEKTKLPLGTVKSRIRLAFTRLRRVLESNGVVEAG